MKIGFERPSLILVESIPIVPIGSEMLVRVKNGMEKIATFCIPAQLECNLFKIIDRA